MSDRRWFPFLSLLFMAVLADAGWSQQMSDAARVDRALRHATPEWQLMAPHMPNLATATPAALETAADVLRARRMPEDALEFYEAALRRGGDEARLRNRMGITLLELRRPELARVCFKRVLALKGKDAEGWNNLGATEYVSRNFSGAIADYKRAVKLNKKGAIFHSNLGTAYFETKDYDSARTQFEIAIKLDRDVFARGGWAGVQAHVLSPQDRGRFCFEMAKLSARHGDDEGVLSWLGKASETGFDVRYEMCGDKDLVAYRKDVRVTKLIENARAMRAGQLAASIAAPALAPANAK